MSIPHDIVSQSKITNALLADLSNKAGDITVRAQTLAAGQTYTSGSEFRIQSDVGVFFRSDQAGTLKFQFSPNNSDWSDFTVDGFAIAANIWEFHTAVKLPRYFRYTYENTSGSTATFDAYVYYGTFRQGNAPLNQSIGDNSDALIVRSVIAAKTENNSYLNAGITEDGELFTNTKASERQTSATFTSGTITGKTFSILVDLSAQDYTNFVSLDNIGLNCNFASNNSNGTVKIGIITRVDATNADISYLVAVPFSAANANTFLSYVNNYQPSAKRFQVSGGALVRAFTNDTETTASVNTGVTLTSPIGNVTPAVGDVVMKFDHTGNNYTAVVSCIYHTD